MNFRDTYNDIAAVYDLLMPDPPRMVEFFRECAREWGRQGRILEVGTGTGRVAVALAAAGFEVDAVDVSEPMLEVLRMKLRRFSPQVARRVTVIHGDLLELELQRQYDLVLVTGGTLQHCRSSEEYEQAFASLGRVLAPGARLVFDIATPPRTTSERFSPVDGRDISPAWHTVESGNDYRMSDDGFVSDCRSWFDICDAAGALALRFVFDFHYTHPSLDDLANWARPVDIEVEATYGDFERGPIRADSSDLVLVARKTPNPGTRHE